jgi:cytochrome c-type biogenesis protein CcmH
MAEGSKMAESDDKAANAKPGCRTGRCRALVLVALVAVAGLLAWWLSGDRAETAAPAVPERGSALLPGAGPARPPQAPMAPSGAAAPQLPGLEVMADKLAKRLEKEPADGEGWALLARTYLELGDVAKADAAYAKALALRPGDEAMKADYSAARKALQP